MENTKHPNPLLLTLLIIFGIFALCCLGFLGFSMLNGALLFSNTGHTSAPIIEEATATLHIQYTETPDATPLPTEQVVPSATITASLTPTGPGYLPLLGRIWTGVKVYYGLLPEKAYGFEILGGSEHCSSMPSGRGVKVKYSNGKEEWKDRLYLVSSGIYFVEENDPALSNLSWQIYDDCP